MLNEYQTANRVLLLLIKQQYLLFIMQNEIL